MKLHDQQYLGLRHTSRVIPADQWPQCQWCEKRLKLRTYWYHLQRDFAGQDKQVAKARAWSKVDLDYGVLLIWCGEFEGWGKDEQQVPLFCTYICAVRFAQLQYRSGQRVTREGRMISRPPQ